MPKWEFKAYLLGETKPILVTIEAETFEEADDKFNEAYPTCTEVFVDPNPSA